MNQEILDFYKDQLKYAGFGDKLNDRLGELFKNDAEKTIVFNTAIEYGRDAAAKTVNYDLRFNKSETTGLFFLNNFSAVMDKGNGELLANTFYLDRAKGITAKEAFNLLEGRSVYKELKNKEGASYHAWVKLNPDIKDEKGNMKFSVFNDNYGYDLSASLAKVQSPDLVFNFSREDTIKSLQKGNLVEMHTADKTEKYFIAAEPQYKSMTVFNEAGEKQFINYKQAESVVQSSSIWENIEEKKNNSVKR